MNGLKLTTLLYKLLAESPVKETISGDIYKSTRPKNSPVEDVVINVLTAGNQQLQTGTANVNIYVPNLFISVNGELQEQPDNTRFEELSTLVEAALKEVYTEDTIIAVEQPGILIEEQFTSLYYVNIRIKYYSINLN